MDRESTSPSAAPVAARAPAVPLDVAATALLLYALWGANPVAVKVALVTLPPIGVAALRFALAGAGLAAWCALRREPLLPSAREAPLLAVNGLVFCMQIATFYLGLSWSSASHGAVLVNSFPIFVAIFAHFYLAGDRLSAGTALGVALGFAGVAVTFFDRWGRASPTMLQGDLLFVASAVLVGAQNTYFKSIIGRVSSYKIIFAQMTICLPAYFTYSVLAEGLLTARPDALALAAVAYQGIVIGAFGFMAWAVLVRRVAVSRLTVFGFSVPVWGVILSHLFLGEPLTGKLVAGMALVVVGIAIAARS